MSACILAQSLSLDHWNPLTAGVVAVAIIYAVSQGAVAIIRAWRGDTTKTGLEDQIGHLVNRVTNNEAAVNSIAKDFVPPDAFAGMLKGQVLDTILEIQRSQDQQAALARPVQVPAAAAVSVQATPRQPARPATATQPAQAAQPAQLTVQAAAGSAPAR